MGHGIEMLPERIVSVEMSNVQSHEAYNASEDQVMLDEEAVRSIVQDAEALNDPQRIPHSLSSVLSREPQVINDTLKLYFADVSQYPMLKREQEVALAKEIEDGNKAALEQLINSNLRLAVSVAKKQVGRGVSFLDLIQEGNIGLTIAAPKYDWRKGTRFSTYAIPWIYKYVKKSVLEDATVIRVPQAQASKLNKLRRSDNTSGLSEKEQQLLAATQNPLSLDWEDSDEREGTLSDILAAEHQPEVEVVEADWRRDVRQVLHDLHEAGELNDNQFNAIVLKFRNTGDDLDNIRIGNRLGVSKERARQVIQETLVKLKRNPQLLEISRQ